MNFYLIRGLSRESGHWGDFVTIFESQFPNASITLMDLPGFGVFNSCNSPLSIKKIVDFLKFNYLIDKDEDNYLVASSLGGIVALDWITRFQDDFRGLVIMNTSFNSICTFSERVRKKSKLDIIKIFLSSKIESKERLTLNINTNFPELHLKTLSEWVEIQKIRKVKRKNVLFQSIAGLTYKPISIFRKTSILTLASKKDKLVCESCFEKVNQFLGGKLVWNENAGHCIPLDDPYWVLNEIVIWIKNLDDNEDFYNRRNK